MVSLFFKLRFRARKLFLWRRYPSTVKYQYQCGTCEMPVNSEFNISVPVPVLIVAILEKFHIWLNFLSWLLYLLYSRSLLGHLDIVKLLVKSGANVNSTTKTNSTPLRHRNTLFVKKKSAMAFLIILVTRAWQRYVWKTLLHQCCESVFIFYGSWSGSGLGSLIRTWIWILVSTMANKN